jgi:hypothetical protein
MTRAPPVAHDGMEAKIGAKKRETRNIRPVTTAVIPVFPPSAATLSASRRSAIFSDTHLQYQWPIR